MKVSVRRFFKGLGITLAILIGLFGLMQLVPYGRTHSNPPTVEEPKWDSPRTRELAKRACFDCHSNETHWPWYANVAPMSWVVQRDVDAARSVVNFSEFHIPYDLASYSGLSVRSGGMPPTKYTVAHPEARLTDEEIADLARGLDATLKGDNARR
jgi:mono/diheme cytochrome c family protein